MDFDRHKCSSLRTQDKTILSYWGKKGGGGELVSNTVQPKDYSHNLENLYKIYLINNVKQTNTTYIKY